MPDDLVKQLAERIAAARLGQERWAAMSEATRITQIQWHGIPAARAVLASGLVVPTSDVLNLADHFADSVEHVDDGQAAELRALTQQEPR